MNLNYRGNAARLRSVAGVSGAQIRARWQHPPQLDMDGESNTNLPLSPKVEPCGENECDESNSNLATHPSTVLNEQQQQQSEDTLLDTATRVRKFNNAGAHCIRAALYTEGWELFKGALELELGSQQTSSPLGASPFVSKAEENYRNLPTLLEQQSEAGSQAGPGVFPTESPLGCSVHGLSLFDPFLFTKAFLVPPVSNSRDTSSKLSKCWQDRTVSAILIFNLGLVEQMTNRTARQAIQLYELAASLLMLRKSPSKPQQPPPPTSVLSMALLNNMGIWWYENSDVVAAHECMERLAGILTRIQQAQPNESRSDNRPCLAPNNAISSEGAAARTSFETSIALDTTPMATATETRGQNQKVTHIQTDLELRDIPLSHLAGSIQAQDLESFRINVRWILYPPGSPSPAA